VDIRVECVTPDSLSGKKRVWFRGIFHLIGILGESPFVSKLRKAESAQHSTQWTGGYAPRFQAFFSALGFFRFDSESQPTHLPLTRAVGTLHTQPGKILGAMRNSSNTV
jgi:hypothetical protein